MKKELLILIAALLLPSCDFPFFNSSDSNSVKESESDKNSESIIKESETNKVQAPFNVDIFVDDLLDVDFHTTAQKNFIAGKPQLAQTYAKGNKELSKPEGVTISWFMEDFEVPDDYLSKFGGFKVKFYEDEKLENPTIYEISDDTSITVTNLFLNHTYYYSVSAFFGEYEFESKLATLKTADTIIRNVDIDGVTNGRDLGNYKTIDGYRVKQGMIYRTARLSENYSVKPLFTEKGYDVLRNVLKIKTEIDLRSVYKNSTVPADNENGSLKNSTLGDDINYYQINYSYYANKDFDDLYDSPNSTGAKKFFKLLAVPENYPIVFHCSVGADRTGYLGFLTLALLGVDLDDCYHDYMFTNFGNISDGRELINLTDYLVKRLNNQLEGDTMQEKVTKYLLSIGVTQAEINSIRSIMLESE